MRIDYKNVSTIEDAFKKVSMNVSESRLKSMGIDAKIKREEDISRISAEGKGFELTISFYEDHCYMDLNLSFLLKPLRSKIEDKISEQLIKLV